jgi:phosphoribosylanthranilate isomerase
MDGARFCSTLSAAEASASEGFSGNVALVRRLDEAWIRRCLSTRLFNLLQAHFRVTADQAENLRDLCGEFGVDLVSLVDPTGGTSAEELSGIFDASEFVLLDHAQGGTGTELPEEGLVDQPMHRCFLAGGINSANAAAKIRLFHPYGLDVQSFTEKRDGSKDMGRVAELLSIIAEADSGDR